MSRIPSVLTDQFWGLKKSDAKVKRSTQSIMSVLTWSNMSKSLALGWCMVQMTVRPPCANDFISNRHWKHVELSNPLQKIHQPKYSDVKASRPDWPRGQKIGLALGLGLETLWPRPSGFGLGLVSKFNIRFYFLAYIITYYVLYSSIHYTFLYRAYSLYLFTNAR